MIILEQPKKALKLVLMYLKFLYIVRRLRVDSLKSNEIRPDFEIEES